MKVDTVLVSAFLAGTADCFAPPSSAPRGIAHRATAHHTDIGAADVASLSQTATGRRLHVPRSRKRSRTWLSSPSGGNHAYAETEAPAVPLLPRRLQETVDRLDREPDLKSKSKLVVELGDAFALTKSAVLLPNEKSQKVPGCVSEVHVAVSVNHPADGAGEAPEGGTTVSIRGTADARLSRGILALLAQGLDGESPSTVLNLRGKALAAAVGLRVGLTDSRINGLGNVLGVIQEQVRGHLDRTASGGEGVGRGGVEARPATAAVGGGALVTEGRSWGSDSSGWFPLPGAEDEVAMLLSGGVDSSVALRLLQDEGYRIRAFYLKIWLEDELSHLGECPWEEDLSYATAVCEQAGVPLEVVPLQREYWEQVVSYTVQEAREGRTPNPDVMCNSRIKFGMFYDHVGRHFRHVATGHYARLEHDLLAPTTAAGAAVVGADDVIAVGAGDVAEERDDRRVRLLLSPDEVKDQTYFLCALNQAQLRKALFPVGAYTKERIRELAESYDLPTKNRKDSQGICFLGKLKFDDFLRHYLGESPGKVVDRETGGVIGEHRGLWFHTIGQRKGVGPGLKPGYVNLGPWYVSGKDMVGNVLEVTNDRDAIEGPRESFQVEALRWIAGRPPAELEREGVMSMQVKTRHGPQMRDCVLTLAEAKSPFSHKNGGAGAGCEGDVETPVGWTPTFARGYVRLGTRDSAIAPGQFAAFYRGEECLGAGVISDSAGVDPLAAVAGAALSTGNGGRAAAESALEASSLVA